MMPSCPLSYKRIKWQIYFMPNPFCVVSFNITLYIPIFKCKEKVITCVLMVFNFSFKASYDYLCETLQFKNAHNLL